MAAPTGAAAPASRMDRFRGLAPGLLLSFGIAAAAIIFRAQTGVAALNPVVVALVVGMGIRALTGPMPVLTPGIAYAVRPVLRAAIVLLGLQVTLPQLLALGPGALALALAVVALTLPFTVWLGGVLGVDRALSQLIGMGTAICGASAIVAANQVVRGKGEDVSYALAVITLCGTAAMLILPGLAGPLGLDAAAYGLWAGASVHEVVQAVGAAAAGGEAAAQSGTVMKLARVFLLAPALLALGWWVSQAAGAGQVKAPVPWFAFGFLGLVVLGSTGLVPAQATEASRFLVPLMMAASVAALGLSTDLRALKARGVRPMALGVGSSLFIAGLALVGVMLIR